MIPSAHTENNTQEERGKNDLNALEPNIAIEDLLLILPFLFFV